MEIKSDIIYADLQWCISSVTIITKGPIFYPVCLAGGEGLGTLALFLLPFFLALTPALVLK